MDAACFPVLYCGGCHGHRTGQASIMSVCSGRDDVVRRRVIRVEWVYSKGNEQKKIKKQYTVLKFKIAITNFANTDPDPDGMQGTDDKVMVKISTDCGGSYTTLHTYDASNTGAITNVLVQQSFDLSAYDGQDIIIAFHATDGPIDDSPDYDFHIDDIFIGTPPDCPEPFGLTTSNITATTADLDWTNGGSEILWDVLWGPDGFDPDIEGTLINRN